MSVLQEAPADIRKDIVKMLAEIIGHRSDSCELGGSSGTAPIHTMAYACGPAECAGLAQLLLTLILELLGKECDAPDMFSASFSPVYALLEAYVSCLLLKRSALGQSSNAYI